MIFLTHGLMKNMPRAIALKVMPDVDNNGLLPLKFLQAQTKKKITRVTQYAHPSTVKRMIHLEKTTQDTIMSTGTGMQFNLILISKPKVTQSATVQDALNTSTQMLRMLTQWTTQFQTLDLIKIS